MSKEEVIAYFGGVSKVAAALGCAVPSVSEWTDVPATRQFQIERITQGQLKVDPKHIPAAALR